MISGTTILFILLMLSGLAYYLGLRRSVAVAGGQEHVRKLHSRPPYYGAMTALWCGIPALIIFFFWQVFEADIITNLVVSGLPENIRNLPADQINLVINDIRNMAAGNIVSSQTSQVIPRNGKKLTKRPRSNCPKTAPSRPSTIRKWPSPESIL